MRRRYNRIKSTLGADPWVTTSKLCARKRPALFPVRDKPVRDLLARESAPRQPGNRRR